MNSKGVGDISEAMCLAKFVKMGWEVYVPFGDNLRCDLVVVRPWVGKLERVQVKTARLKNGVITGRCDSSYAHRGRPSKSYKGEVDWIAMFCPENEKVYLLNPEEVGGASVNLRIGQSRNNQVVGVRRAEDFELEKFIAPVAQW